MELKDQVVSLELSKKLKELGVKQESLFYWSELAPGHYSGETHMLSYFVVMNSKPYNESFSAFTVAELGEMLPDTFDGYKWIEMGRNRGQHVVRYQKEDNELQPITKEADTEVKARAKMLIYLIESGLNQK